MMIFDDLPCFSSYTREEALSLLLDEEYGRLPSQPDTLEFHVVRREEDALAGKATHLTVEAWVTLCGRGFSFPFELVCPKAERPVPCVVLISFTPEVPAAYLPSEELCDLGLAVASFHCGAVSPDNGDFSAKAGGLFQVDRGGDTAPGKLALWAWGASVVREYLGTCSEIDQEAVAVAGHSRLGKAALLAGALDERFQFVFSNESGCSGAALYRGKKGETAADIQQMFPYWFSPSFANCTGNPDQLPFDQHFLLSLIAPRHLYVSSAEEDLWSDPAAEFRGCLAATPAFEAMGVSGLVGVGARPQLGMAYHQGNIGYHLRAGKHFFSREDWRQFTAYLLFHRKPRG